MSVYLIWPWCLHHSLSLARYTLCSCDDITHLHYVKLLSRLHWRLRTTLLRAFSSFHSPILCASWFCFHDILNYSFLHPAFHLCRVHTLRSSFTTFFHLYSHSPFVIRCRNCLESSHKLFRSHHISQTLLPIVARIASTHLPAIIIAFLPATSELASVKLRL